MVKINRMISTDIKRGANFSHCGKYRYWLYREWHGYKPRALCIGLNPSTANDQDDDRTIESLIRILDHNGFGSFYMMNLFALISKNPEDLRACPDPLKDNDQWIDSIAKKCDVEIFCWGAFPMTAYRVKKFKLQFPEALCLGKNYDGSPVHPLYKKSTTKLVRY